MMTWNTINKSGYFLEKNHLPHEKGMKTAATFLHQMTEEFGRSCRKYYDVLKELPFTYHERQIHSILLPSIAKISQVAFVEQPIVRKNDGNLQHGWVDYWVYYEKFVFLIELKHGWHALNSKKIRVGTHQSWKKGVEQIKSISKLEANSICINPNKILKMTLMVVPYYRGSNKVNYLTPLDKTEVTRAHDLLINSLSPVPNWNSLWALHKNIQEVRNFGNDSSEIYPSVGFFAKVTSL